MATAPPAAPTDAAPAPGGKKSRKKLIIIVGVVVVNTLGWLQPTTQALDKYFEGHPDLYLFTVMVGAGGPGVVGLRGASPQRRNSW
jgi:hypothetical protein